MAAPSYSEDLTDIDLAESGSTGVAINFSGGGGGAPATGVDTAMQGTNNWDRPVSTAERAIVFNQTPGTGTVAAGVHIFQWLFNGTPGLSDTLATRGAYIVIGTGTGDTMQFHVEGSDTYGAAGRVGKCYVVDYHTTANTGSIPYSTKVGTPGATPTYFGAGLKTTGSAKGSNLGVDAIRYGTGAYITAGDATTPATFGGFSTVNDYNDATNGYNRWGILTNIGGIYELQGRFVVGQNNAGTPTAAHFDDSAGVTILLVDTVHSSTDFTQIIVDHASTVFNMAGATIKALGTNNPGRLVFNNASTVATLDSNVFDSIGITTLRDAVTATSNTWKGCDQITQNGATITGGVIRDSAVNSALLIDTAIEAADITGVSFVDNNVGGSGSGDTIDSYSESNHDLDQNLHSASLIGQSQSFTGDGRKLGAATFYLDKSGSPTGDAVAKLYAHSGTYGTSSIPTGTALATSDPLDVSTLTTSAVLTDLIFPDDQRVTLVDGTEYVVTIEYSGGDGSNRIFAGVDGSSPTHGGNWASLTGSTWTANSGRDLIFYIKTSPGHSIELTATGAHTFTDITFSGGGGTPGSNLVASTGSDSADVYNNSGGAVTINVTGGDSPSVRNAASSTTTVVATVPITITVTDVGGNLLTDVQTAVYLTSDRTEVLNEDTVAGVASGTLDASLAPAAVEVRCRKTSTGTTRYRNFSTNQTVAAGTGLTLAVTMVEDTLVAS